MRHTVVARGISQRRVSPGLGDSLMRVVSLLAASCPPGGRIAPASCPPPPPSRFRELPPVGPRRPCVGSSRLLIWKWAESPGENGEWESSGGECGTEEVASGSPDAATRLFKCASRFPEDLVWSLLAADFARCMHICSVIIAADFVARLALTALLAFAPTTALGSRPAPKTPSGR